MINSTIAKRTLGVNFNASGHAEIFLWVPKAGNVAIRIERGEDIPLSKKARGYWHTVTDQLQPGMLYRVVIDGQSFPDIYSLSQPSGVHGASMTIKLNDHRWTDEHWNNLPLEEYLLYELHTGTYTAEGTFAGIEQRLDHLKALGITAIELMPVAQFPGTRNWGYDGVFPFAVQESYGGAAALQQLVNSCHHKGLAVVLDVVYNHVGPEGNYLSQYGPYFTDKYKTPWGDAINFDDAGCDEVRRFFIENALMWLRDFHIDALRLDAVHAIKDFSPKHILKELKEQVNLLMQATGQTHYLIIECDLNDHRYIDPLNAQGLGMDAQWNDEFHHALRVTAGEKKEGYYTDFDPISSLKESFEHAYVYHGQYSAQREKTFGTDPAENLGRQFVVFSQNHDQVGNRMLGERSSQLFSFEMQKLMAATVIISPFLPMLFMGEEYSESNPFLYFVSHTDPDLVEAVRKGRKAEFAAFHHGEDARDPQAEQTFHQSKLQWNKLEQEPYQTMFSYYQALISLRKTHPALGSTDRKALKVDFDDNKKTMTIIRQHDNKSVYCMLNFSAEQQSVSVPVKGRFRPLFNSASDQWNGPGSSTEDIETGSSLILQPESILILEEHV
ncbi:malto-oligosyltrehalose trehalohydrolase [Mucilaginibacter pocheonensis]|uniref:Malto-oligosyltrehalose trehalohydrolase n=1 Tax=Mucilaginibacter pocheonensis TaxID=398050 RepID=A0ABU1TFH3_9SPHI|nr:malto-oligosyltrehalose trehalohydrolase [Mucilaginibacter pocheonensis]MDR6944069.1 maltooligosyltrehalose trehalohydrolase [Mucilaginibacter pocheonensis]